MSFKPLGLTPLIGVFDMPRALEFYRDLLGFVVVSASPEVETREGRFSHWMWLRSGAVEIMLNTQYDSNERPEYPPETVDSGRGACIYIGCSDVEEPYEQLTRRGLQADPPQLTPYGLKVFSVKDPDGYQLVFQGVRRASVQVVKGKKEMMGVMKFEIAVREPAG